jgi:hypothetical protein
LMSPYYSTLSLSLLLHTHIYIRQIGSHINPAHKTYCLYAILHASTHKHTHCLITFFIFIFSRCSTVHQVHPTSPRNHVLISPRILPQLKFLVIRAKIFTDLLAANSNNCSHAFSFHSQPSSSRQIRQRLAWSSIRQTRLRRRFHLGAAHFVTSKLLVPFFELAQLIHADT